MVDIIIPVYNVAPYLRECLDSVLKQTYKDIHMIIIDDGSTDGSALICDEYMKYPNVTVHHQCNSGISITRNKGLALSHSDYVMFLDSDDWMEPETVESLMSLLKSSCADIACCRFYFEYEQKRVSSCIQTGNVNLYGSESALKVLFAMKAIRFAPWGKLYKREIFDGIQFPAHKIHEDIPVMVELLLKANSVVTIEKAYIHYRQQPGSLSRDEYNEKHRALYDFMLANREIINKYPSLQDAYNACFFTAIKDLLSLFKSKVIKEKYRDDYQLYYSILKDNVFCIFSNSELSLRSKLSIISVLFPFRNLIKKCFLVMK